ncbi:hypothetical protein R1sor_027348 [Riccia sorocarpa]|uniref:MyTH4 domain-containing protein n=1 Tax=Riccia sorocarpa TaxID=122646 RepID=A0ABD3GDY7_9MARC
MNFSAQPKGIWPFSVWKRVKFDLLLMYTKPRQHPCAPVSSWQDPLREPLLRSVPYRLRSKGLAVFAHLMAYMGDVPTSQSSTWHIHQILSCGIRYTGLRDEIYCQIIKQTTANPSRLSNVKGWQAMAICCGVFLPSDSFYLYLAAHLEQVASGNIARQGTADQLGQFAHGMVNPAEAAAYALERLRKLKRIGPRRLLPLSKEIEVVENMDTIPAEVALPDGSWQAFLLRPMDTSKEVVEHLVSILGLLEARSYGLYQLEPNGVEKLIASNAYILEVQAKCNAPATTPQNIQDIRFGAKSVEKLSRLLCGSANALVENSSPTTSVLRSEELGLGERGAGPQQFSDGSLHMMLKRKLYFIDLEKLPEDLRAIVLAFEYSQAVHDIVKGVHMVQEGDAMMLGAMQLRADCGTSRVDPEILAGIDGSKYGPPYCVQGNEGAWKDAIATTLASLPSSGGNSASWKQDYIDYVKARCPLYEACLFFVKPLSNFSMPEAMYLAVSSTGVSFVDASTRGLEISNTIQMCIGLLQAIQQKTIQAEPGGAGSQWDKPPQPFLQGEESDAYASDSSISSYGGTPDLVQAHAQAPVRQSSVAEQPWPQTPLEEATAQARSPSGASEEQQHRRKHRKHQKNPDNEQPLSPPSGS